MLYYISVCIITVLAGIAHGVCGFGAGIVMMTVLPSFFSISQSAALQDGVNWFSGETVEDHRLILSFLRIRDQEGAEAAMRLHLVHIINRLNLPDDGEPVL